ncbi:unnamed protein product [Arabidopsis halleri]
MEEIFCFYTVTFFFFLIHGERYWVLGGIQMSEQNLWLG